MPSPTQLFEWVCDTWGVPVNIICDRFRLGELQDAVQGACPVEGRVKRAGLMRRRIFELCGKVHARRPFQHGDEGSRALLIASLSSGVH